MTGPIVIPTLSPEEILDLEEREIAHGRAIEVLLSDDNLRRVLTEVRDEWTAAWQKSAPSQVDVREELYRRLLGLDELLGRLAEIVETGKLASRAQADREAARRLKESR